MTGVTARGLSCVRCDLRRPVAPVRRKEGSEPKKETPQLIRPVNKLVNQNGVSSNGPQPEMSTEESEAFEELRKHLVTLQRTEPRLLSGISRKNAVSHLRRVAVVLQNSDLVGETEVMFVADVMGTIVLRSPLKPTDALLRPLVERLSEVVEQRLDCFSTSDLCGLIWVYGCFGPSVLLPSLFSGVKRTVLLICMRIEGESVRSIQDVTRLFQGLQRLKFSSHTDVTHQTLRKVNPALKSLNFTMDELAKLVLVSAKLRVYGGCEFLRNAMRLARYQFHNFSDKAFSDFVNGFVIYDIRIMPQAFGQLAKEVQNRVESMSAAQLIDITLALSKLHYLPSDAYLSAISQKIQSQIPKLTPKDISFCVLAMGHLNFYSAGLMDALIERFCQIEQTFDSFMICNILLGCIRLDALNEKLLEAGLKGLTRDLKYGLVKTQALIVYQVLTHAKLFLGMDTIPSEIFPESWQRKVRKTWMDDQRRPPYGVESSLIKIARQLDLDVQYTQSPIGDISIILVHSPDGMRRVVLDLMMPKKNCFMNQRAKMLPLNQWQHRVLKKQGFGVLTVSELKWMQWSDTHKLKHLASQLGFWTPEEILRFEERAGVVRSRDRSKDVFHSE